MPHERNNGTMGRCPSVVFGPHHSGHLNLGRYPIRKNKAQSSHSKPHLCAWDGPYCARRKNDHQGTDNWAKIIARATTPCWQYGFYLCSTAQYGAMVYRAQSNGGWSRR